MVNNLKHTVWEAIFSRKKVLWVLEKCKQIAIQRMAYAEKWSEISGILLVIALLLLMLTGKAIASFTEPIPLAILIPKYFILSIFFFGTILWFSSITIGPAIDLFQEVKKKIYG